jgi:hypothetical protein
MGYAASFDALSLMVFAPSPLAVQTVWIPFLFHGERNSLSRYTDDAVQ